MIYGGNLRILEQAIKKRGSNWDFGNDTNGG